MPTYDETKDTDSKLEKQAQNIKENVVGLARTLKDSSTDKAHDAADYVRDRVGDLQTSGTDTLEKIEYRIKSKPAQSVAIAFAAGLLASFLFGRRSS